MHILTILALSNMSRTLTDAATIGGIALVLIVDRITEMKIPIFIGAQYSTVKYSTVQYSTVQYSTVQCSAVQYSTVQYSGVRAHSVI